MSHFTDKMEQFLATLPTSEVAINRWRASTGHQKKHEEVTEERRRIAKLSSSTKMPSMSMTNATAPRHNAYKPRNSCFEMSANSPDPNSDAELLHFFKTNLYIY